jgi:hypothetical protein
MKVARFATTVCNDQERIPMSTREQLRFVGVVLVMAVVASTSNGYIHFPPVTMPKMCEHSQAIRVLTVKKHDKEKGVIVFEVTETLKGKTPDGTMFKHVIGKEDKGTKAIFDWVADGKKAMMFTIETGANGIACGYVFIDKYCYSIDRSGTGEFWLLIRTDPEMAATFFGTVETLQKISKDLLAGKDVKVPVDESLKPVPNEERRKRAAALEEIMIRNRKK